MIWNGRIGNKKHSLAQDGDEHGKGKLCRDLDQRDISISHVKEEIKKCLCDKIIAA